jgi:hypothetical protein
MTVCDECLLCTVHSFWMAKLAARPGKARLDIIRLGMALVCLLAVSVFVLFFFLESTVRLVAGLSRSSSHALHTSVSVWSRGFFFFLKRSLVVIYRHFCQLPWSIFHQTNHIIRLVLQMSPPWPLQSKRLPLM